MHRGLVSVAYSTSECNS